MMCPTKRRWQVGLCLLLCLTFVAGNGWLIPARHVALLYPGIAHAAPAITVAEIDRYLESKNSPLAGHGEAFLDSGRRWNVDPRLVVAIAGAETTFGTRMCADFNAWNWFYMDTSRCSPNAFDSWEDGIEQVTRGLKQSYLDRGRTTISAIAETYTATDRETWIGNVTLFCQELGGDLNDLTFVESAATPVTLAKSAAALATPSPWDISWVPADAAGRNAIIVAIGSIVSSPAEGGAADAGLRGHEASILEYALASIDGNPAGVNPAFALAMFRKEANFARPGKIAYSQNNPGNMRCTNFYGETGCQNGFAVFGTMRDGIRAYFWLLTREYKPGGRFPSNRNCSDIPCIITAYCPPSKCDTQRYIAQVTEWTEQYQHRLCPFTNVACALPPPPISSLQTETKDFDLALAGFFGLFKWYDFTVEGKGRIRVSIDNGLVIDTCPEGCREPTSSASRIMLSPECHDLQIQYEAAYGRPTLTISAFGSTRDAYRDLPPCLATCRLPPPIDSLETERRDLNFTGFFGLFGLYNFAIEGEGRVRVSIDDHLIIDTCPALGEDWKPNRSAERIRLDPGCHRVQLQYETAHGPPRLGISRWPESPDFDRVLPPCEQPPPEQPVNTPEQVVRTFFGAMDRLDVAAATETIAPVPGYRQVVEVVLGLYKRVMEGLNWDNDFSQLQYEVLSNDGRSAKVRAWGPVVIRNTQNGSIVSELDDFDVEIPVSNFLVRWYIYIRP
jgi:hypothetical protein